MSSSNPRFGRRAARQSDDLRAEPVLSFDPKKGAAARDLNRNPGPSLDQRRSAQAAPRVEREDAEEFGAHFGGDSDPMPRFLRNDGDFNPRTNRHDPLDQRIPASERPLYHHLFDENENRRRGIGWMAALGSVAVVAIGAAYAWHSFMARPAPANLFEPPGFATRGNTGYVTPQQPAAPDADSSPAPLAATPPAAASAPPAQDIASRPEPKSIPAEAPPPPRKTISEAAANPTSLGAPAESPPPPPAATKPTTKPAVAKAAPEVTPPPKQEVAKTEAPKPATPKPEAAKRETPRKEAAITPPKPSPAPQHPIPRQSAEPPAAPQTAAAPALAPLRPRDPQATAQPQSLSREAPAAYPLYPQPQRQQAPQQQQQQQPSFATRSPPPAYAAPNAAPENPGPPPTGPDTVTVDGITYVNGQQPHALGTLSGPPDGSDVAMPAGAAPTPLQAAPPAYPARPYLPADRDGSAPLPNDVIILPGGQLAVPNGR